MTRYRTETAKFFRRCADEYAQFLDQSGPRYDGDTDYTLTTSWDGGANTATHAVAEYDVLKDLGLSYEDYQIIADINIAKWEAIVAKIDAREEEILKTELPILAKWEYLPDYNRMKIWATEGIGYLPAPYEAVARSRAGTIAADEQRSPETS